jgi:tetratricopeptide (TPR) repeat protein
VRFIGSGRMAGAFLIAFGLVPVLASEDSQGFEILLKRAQDHRMAGRNDEALDELLALLASLRGHPELRALALNANRETAEAYLSRGDRSKDDLARAAACFEAVVAEQPEDAFLHYRLGLVYRELGDNRRAALHLQDAVKGGFRNLGARINLIEAAFASGQSVLGLQAARDVISPSLRSPDVLLRLGRLLFDHLFYQEALKAFQLAHQAAPEAFEPRFRLALTHYLLKEYADTVATLQPATALESNPEAASLDASAEAQLGHTDAAVSILRRAIERFPKSSHPYINLALIELDLGNAGEAEKLLEQLRSLPVQRDVKVFYAVNRNSCRDLANSIDHANAPGHSSPDTAEFYYQLAVQLQQRFHYASAVELIRLAQANEGSSARVLYVAGTSCLNLDPQAPEPIQFLRGAVERNPKFDQAYYILGRAYTRRGDLEGALQSYREAARLRPDPSYFLSLGKTLTKSGNSSEPDQDHAIAAYEQALALDPSYAEAHLELGRLYVQMKNLEKARTQLQKAIELEPDFYEADYLLGRLLYSMGDSEQSRGYMASFEEKKSVLMEQSVVGSGFIFGGQ